MAASILLPDRTFEEHYSLADLAKQWKFSRSSVRLMILDEPGVARISLGKTSMPRYSIPTIRGPPCPRPPDGPAARRLTLEGEFVDTGVFGAKSDHPTLVRSLELDPVELVKLVLLETVPEVYAILFTPCPVASPQIRSSGGS